MSEFIHKAKIAALEQSNAELNNEISNLKAELDDLNCEIKRFREQNPDDIQQLEAKIAEYERREAELKERIVSISAEAKNNNKSDGVVKALLSALQVEDATIVEAAIEQYYKKRGMPKIMVAFLLGVLVSLAIWLVSVYLENDESFNTIIEYLNKLVK